MAGLPRTLKGIGAAVGDAGYLSRRNSTEPGHNRLIATGNAAP